MNVEKAKGWGSPISNHCSAYFRHFSREVQDPFACQIYVWLLTLEDVLHSVFKENY